MQIDEISYLDQLYEGATAKVGNSFDAAAERDRCKRRFLDNVFLLWPEISAIFD